MSESKFVAVDRQQLLHTLVTLGMKENEAVAWLGYVKQDLCTIEDFQKNIVENSERWFPNAYDTPENQLLTNLLGIVGEAGEMADVHKKHLRGSIGGYEALQMMIEESIDLWHYLAQFWYYLKVDIQEVYLDKTAFNEERFGCRED